MSNEQLNLFPEHHSDQADQEPFDSAAVAAQIATSVDTAAHRKAMHDIRHREAKREGLDPPVEEFARDDEQVSTVAQQASETSPMPESLKQKAKELKRDRAPYVDPAVRLGGAAVHDAYVNGKDTSNAAAIFDRHNSATP